MYWVKHLQYVYTSKMIQLFTVLSCCFCGSIRFADIRLCARRTEIVCVSVLEVRPKCLLTKKVGECPSKYDTLCRRVAPFQTQNSKCFCNGDNLQCNLYFRPLLLLLLFLLARLNKQMNRKKSNQTFNVINKPIHLQSGCTKSHK